MAVVSPPIIVLEQNALCSATGNFLKQGPNLYPL